MSPFQTYLPHFSRRVVTWAAGLTLSAVCAALAYVGQDILAQTDRVPILEQRLSDHEHHVEGKLERIESRLDKLVELLLERKEKNDDRKNR